jgi:hypothetical protein
MSFTIKCDKCGKEQKLIDDFHKNDDNTIEVYPESYTDFDVQITCKCGNVVGS